MLTISEGRKAFWAEAKNRFSAADTEVLKKAVAVAEQAHRGQRRGTGEPYVCHSLAVAQILLSWNLDAATIAAGLLHDVPEDTAVSLDEVRRQFGEEIAGLVDSVTKLSTVRVPREEINYEVENLRHLFLAMAQDLRVVLLKLADRLHNMRTLKGVSPEKRTRIGRETIEIFAPLADRLGMGEVRSELDDLGFRYAEPAEYQWTRRQLMQSDEKRARYITKVKHAFNEELAEEHIAAEISARVKNLYSLYKKLLQKERDIDKVYDLFAIRIIVGSIAECYQGMGVIHRHWQPLPHRIKDYIAVPKLNGYRSLHTTIFGPGNRLLEVQLRTREMHEEAELGVAAHVAYAEQKQSVKAPEEQLAVMRQLASWQDEIKESNEFVDRFKLDMFANRIFAFTPKGALYSLPAGATPVDFAYYVHTEVGHTCRGAKVNGVIVPLDAALANGDVVEILTQKGGTPKRDWLAFVRTGHARSHIRSFFRKSQRGDSLAAGKQLLSAALEKSGAKSVDGLTKKQQGELTSAVPGARSLDDVLVRVGEGSVTVQSLLRRLGLEAAPDQRPKRKPGRPVAVALSGLTSLVTKRARCCNPEPPEPVVGYVTVGKGISIHRQSCSHVKNLPDPSRLVEVSWEGR